MDPLIKSQLLTSEGQNGTGRGSSAGGWTRVSIRAARRDTAGTLSLLTNAKFLETLALPRETPFSREIRHLGRGLGRNGLIEAHSVSPGLPKPRTSDLQEHGLTHTLRRKDTAKKRKKISTLHNGLGLRYARP